MAQYLDKYGKESDSSINLFLCQLSATIYYLLFAMITCSQTSYESFKF